MKLVPQGTGVADRDGPTCGTWKWMAKSGKAPHPLREWDGFLPFCFHFLHQVINEHTSKSAGSWDNPVHRQMTLSWSLEGNRLKLINKCMKQLQIVKRSMKETVLREQIIGGGGGVREPRKVGTSGLLASLGHSGRIFLYPT